MSGSKPLHIQMIDVQGNFNEDGLQSFAKTIKLASCGLSYAVISIMGPQGSGKSTLLNHLFHTEFTEMDALKGRSQTTQGIWLAKAIDINPCTLVMDLEGTDGRERGEENTAFEKQSALFALAVSDVVLINMWCHDIGRDHAANKPLLRTVFEVMMRLFTPRKSTLFFVIRDQTKTPLSILDPALREDVQKIWAAIKKPDKYKNTPLSEFFNVEVTALPSYEEKEDQFEEQVTQLRQRFVNSIAPGGIAGDRQAVVPGSGFPLSIYEMWKVIKQNKDLDLPAHKIMVATVRCEDIAHECLSKLISDEIWHELEQDAKSNAVPGFGKKVNSLLKKCLFRYDTEAAYFDESVRSAKRQQLLNKALDIFYPSYQAVSGHHRKIAFDKFKEKLDHLLEASDGEGFAAAVRQCSESCIRDFSQATEDARGQNFGWDSQKIRDKLCNDIDAHAARVRSEKLNQLVEKYKKHLEDALSEPVALLLHAAKEDTWTLIRSRLAQETESAKVNMAISLSGYEIGKEEETQILKKIQDIGRNIVEKKAREEASQALILMKDRFTTVFSYDTDSLPRIWTEKEDTRPVIRNARLSVVKLLSTLAALRLDGKKPDKIESALVAAFIDSNEWTNNGRAITYSSLSSVSDNPLTSNNWEGVDAKDTLITPIQCRALWRQFKAETEYTISQALTAQASIKRSASLIPPLWASIAIMVLGYNEFMALLRKPIYLVVLFVLILLGRALWVQLGMSTYFQYGLLSGTISFSSKMLPNFIKILRNLAEGGQGQTGAQSQGQNQTDGNHGNSSGIPRGKGNQVPLQDMTSKG